MANRQKYILTWDTSPSDFQVCSCLSWTWCIICILGKTIEPLYGGETSRKCVSDVAELNDDIVNTVLGILGPDSAFMYHNTFTCYKRFTDIRNLILILEEPEVTVEINKLPEAVHNPYTRSTSSHRPESVFIRTSLIVPYVGMIGFGWKRKTVRDKFILCNHISGVNLLGAMRWRFC